MNGETHKIGGVCAGIIAGAILIEPPYTLDKLTLTGVLIGGSLIGSLMPDIDHKGTTIGSKFKLISIVINNLFGHRGATHAPIVHMLITTILLILGGGLTDYPKLIYTSFVIGLFIGGISHLLLDSITVKGIPLLYPISNRKFRLCKLTVGKQELLIQAILVVLTIFSLNIIL